MKLTGRINKIERIVARRNKDDPFEEKRVFQINVRPATPQPSGYYGYGGLRFVLHGQELEDFGADLDDEVEVFVVRSGGDYDNRQIEDVSRALYEAQGKLTTAEQTIASIRSRQADDDRRNSELTKRNQALELELIRTTTQLETLRRVGLAALDEMKQIEGSRDGG